MLRETREIERHRFQNMEELRDYLLKHTASQLGVIDPDGGDYFTVTMFEETLSDGSTVTNCRITTDY